MSFIFMNISSFKRSLACTFSLSLSANYLILMFFSVQSYFFRSSLSFSQFSLSFMQEANSFSWFSSPITSMVINFLYYQIYLSLVYSDTPKSTLRYLSFQLVPWLWFKARFSSVRGRGFFNLACLFLLHDFILLVSVL